MLSVSFAVNAPELALRLQWCCSGRAAQSTKLMLIQKIRGALDDECFSSSSKDSSALSLDVLK
jgi:hypothetical protein